jgi:uncharacterized protein YegP (UPF0339 family)
MDEEIKIHDFEIYPVKRGLFKNRTEWMWTVKASNGKTMDTSTESFKNRGDCEYNAKSTAASIQAHFGTSPIEQLIHALKEDEDYFQSWKANIAMSFLDAMDEDNLIKPNQKEKVHERANTAAENFLQQLIK